MFFPPSISPALSRFLLLLVLSLQAEVYRDPQICVLVVLNAIRTSDNEFLEQLKPGDSWSEERVHKGERVVTFCSL
jgi:hypothetical protein